MRQNEHVKRRGEMRNVYKILVGKPVHRLCKYTHPQAHARAHTHSHIYSDI